MLNLMLPWDKASGLVVSARFRFATQAWHDVAVTICELDSWRCRQLHKKACVSVTC
jgi:hypothetical protein